ncbi:PrgI family protein [bacterium]|nr:PrgI family protein [bacterium]
MQFQVPQFIEVEDKIFGPLTFKQFVYVLGGLGCAYLAYRMLPLYAAAPFMLLGAAAGGALAFMEYNGRPLILALEHGFFFLIRSKLYLWNNTRQLPVRAPTKDATPQPLPYVPRLSESRLHELSWSLDIKERISDGVATQKDRTQNTNSLSTIVAPVRTARESLIR